MITLQSHQAPVNITNAAPQFVPAAPTTPARRYEHSYQAPSEQFHLVANSDAEILMPAVGRTAYAILECLRSHLNSQTGQCNPSLATIAAETGAHPSTVSANLKYLEEANVALKAPRRIEHCRRGRTTRQKISNQYILNAREQWTPERVTRKRAQKVVSQNRSTLVEYLPTGCREIVQPGSAESSTNKTNPKKTKSKTQTEHRAREKVQQAPTPEAVVEVAKAHNDTNRELCEQSEMQVLVDAALVAQVLAVGVKPERAARDLVAKHAPEIVRAQLEYLDAREPKNPGAVLAKSIRENWDAPAKYLERIEAQDAALRAAERREAQVLAEREKAQQKVTESKQRVSEEEDAARLDAAWEALPAMKREAIEREVIKRLGPIYQMRRHVGADCSGGLRAMVRLVQREWAVGVATPGPLFQ